VIRTIVTCSCCLTEVKAPNGSITDRCPRYWRVEFNNINSSIRPDGSESVDLCDVCKPLLETTFFNRFREMQGIAKKCRELDEAAEISIKQLDTELKRDYGG